MIQILGISGSLRQSSFNTAVLRAAQELTGDDVKLEIATLHGIPLYDADLEQEHGLPKAVTELKERIFASDGVLLATPEYNNGIPGVFKNAIDWLSRPPEDIVRVFGQRPYAVLGASPGNFGTILSQDHWLPVLRTLRAPLWSTGRLLISRAGSVFDADGQLTDETVRKNLGNFIQGFATHIAQS
jgi:NAD(P)H-dependent FMN reductase